MTNSPDTEFFDPKHQQTQDWDRLAAFLDGKGHRLVLDPPPRQFTGGFGNLNFLVSVDDQQFVLRRPPLGPLPPGANDMGREFKVLTGLNKAFPLAPKALIFSDDEDILGAPFFLMEYRPGLVVRDVVPPELQDKGPDLSRMLVDVLAEFQRVDPDAVGLGDLGNPDGFLVRAVKGWIKRFNVAAADVYTDRPIPTSASEVIAWLEAQSVPEGGVTLLHNDYKLNNIILDPDAPTKPIALLDWDMCTRGDPLFDLGTTLSYWVEPDDPSAMHEMGQMPTVKSPGWLTRREVLDYYVQQTGRDVSNIHFYRVLTSFKLGVIFLQIYARFCRGTTSDPRIEALGPTTDGIFDFSHDVMSGRMF